MSIILFVLRSYRICIFFGHQELLTAVGEIGFLIQDQECQGKVFSQDSSLCFDEFERLDQVLPRVSFGNQ